MFFFTKPRMESISYQLYSGLVEFSLLIIDNRVAIELNAGLRETRNSIILFTATREETTRISFTEGKKHGDIALRQSLGIWQILSLFLSIEHRVESHELKY